MIKDKILHYVKNLHKFRQAYLKIKQKKSIGLITLK